MKESRGRAEEREKNRGRDKRRIVKEREDMKNSDGKEGGGVRE